VQKYSSVKQKAVQKGGGAVPEPVPEERSQTNEFDESAVFYM